MLMQVCCKTPLCIVNSNFEQLWGDLLRSVNCSHSGMAGHTAAGINTPSAFLHEPYHKECIWGQQQF